MKIFSPHLLSCYILEIVCIVLFFVITIRFHNLASPFVDVVIDSVQCIGWNIQEEEIDRRKEKENYSYRSETWR